LGALNCYVYHLQLDITPLRSLASFRDHDEALLHLGAGKVRDAIDSIGFKPSPMGSLGITIQNGVINPWNLEEPSKIWGLS